MEKPIMIIYRWCGYLLNSVNLGYEDDYIIRAGFDGTFYAYVDKAMFLKSNLTDIEYKKACKAKFSSLEEAKQYVVDIGIKVIDDKLLILI